MDPCLNFDKEVSLRDFYKIAKSFYSEYKLDKKFSQLETDDYNNYFIPIFLKNNHNILLNCEPYKILKNGIARIKSTEGLNLIGFKLTHKFPNNSNKVESIIGNIYIFKIITVNSEKKYKLYQNHDNIKAEWSDELNVWIVKLLETNIDRHNNNLFIKINPRPIMSNELYMT